VLIDYTFLPLIAFKAYRCWRERSERYFQWPLSCNFTSYKNITWTNIAYFKRPVGALSLRQHYLVLALRVLNRWEGSQKHNSYII